MVEVELKYQVPADRREAVRAFVAGRSPTAMRRTRLQAAYFDTPQRLLAQAGLALRIRREGRRWVQTLKGGTDDGWSRLEHNVPLRDDQVDARALRVDPHRHAGTAVGDRLTKLLASQAPQALACTYRSDIQRSSRTLRTRHGSVELAFDEGRLLAGDDDLAVCELEIELLSGQPAAVLDVARRWALRLGLWLDVRSKAERGDMLSRGVAMAAPRGAVEVRLERHQGAREAWRVALAGCREQVLANASQIGSGEHAAEHVHQLRVGLRRLRSALSLFAREPELAGLVAPLGEPAAVLFRRLGAARDAAIVEGELAVALGEALRSIGAAERPLRPLPDAPSESATAVLREAGSQALLLDLIAAGLDAGSTEPSLARPGLRARLSRRLARWHEAISEDVSQFDRLDAAARHRLRKRIKRLRYAAEMAASLFDAGKVRRALKPLARVQQRLGQLNDIAVGLRAFDAQKAHDPRAWFALGWLAARRDVLLAGAVADLKALRKARPFWKGG